MGPKPAHAQLILFLSVSTLLMEGLAALWLDGPRAPGMPAYRILHLAEMLALILLVAREIDWRLRESQWVFAGLVLSLGGDIINSFLIDLGFIIRPQTLLSIPFFVLAHLCYIACFVRLLRKPPLGVQPMPGTYWWLALLSWPVLALGLWTLVIDPAAPPLFLRLSVGYALVVTLMGVVALLLGLRLGGRAWLPALGGLSFVLSDSIFGSYLLQGQDRPVLASQAIWLTYFLAQVLISRAPALRRPNQ